MLTGGAAQILDVSVASRVVDLFVGGHGDPRILIDHCYRIWVDGMTGLRFVDLRSTQRHESIRVVNYSRYGLPCAAGESWPPSVPWLGARSSLRTRVIRKNLVDFANWAISHYPAQHYLL